MHAFISLYVCIHLLYPCHMYLLRFNKNVIMEICYQYGNQLLTVINYQINHLRQQ